MTQHTEFSPHEGVYNHDPFYNDQKRPTQGAAHPTPDPAITTQGQRAELETGFTNWEWAVGMVLCPAREKCTAGRSDQLFRPLKDGRLPMHRGLFGVPCAGAHKRPATPPLQLHASDQPTA